MTCGRVESVLQSKDNGIWANGVVLSFDFVVDDLRIYYSETAPQGAYEVIKSYLLKNGFEHLKDSDYRNENIDDLETAELLYHFSINNKWFPYCLKKMDISPNVIKLDVSADIRAFCDEEWWMQRIKPTPPTIKGTRHKTDN
jgi:virulence-associated protein VapD